MTYATLARTWGGDIDEPFFVGYALRGRIVNKAGGLRSGLPQLGPIEGPESEPSPLNVEWRKQFADAGNTPWETMGVL